MRLSPQAPVLLLAHLGQMALCQKKNTIVGLSIADRTERFRCEGRLLGVSESTRFFVVEQTPGTYLLFDAETGTLLNPSDALCNDLPFDARYALYFVDKNAERILLRFIDVTSQEPQKDVSIPLSRTTFTSLDNWMLCSPDNHIATAWSWASDDVDGAYGSLYASDGTRVDTKPFAGLTVSRFHSVPPLYVSREHNLLATGTQNGFYLYQATTGDPWSGKSAKLELPTFGGDVIAFCKQDKNRLAVNKDPVLQKDLPKQGAWIVRPRPDQALCEILCDCSVSQPVTGLVFGEQGTSLYAILADHTFCEWNASTGEQLASTKLA